MPGNGVLEGMAIHRTTLLLLVALFTASAKAQPAPSKYEQGTITASAQVEQLFAQANQSRAAAGLGPLHWDPALAIAAGKHCSRMAAERSLSHRYDGELDLTERAGQSGAHFARIEENIAAATRAGDIHPGWMGSPPHRANLLNAEIDSVGIAVISSGGLFYAVADYALAVPVRSQTEVESALADLLRRHKIQVRRDPTDARAACALQSGFPRTLTGAQPGYVMRWQDADLSHLPQALQQRIGSGDYAQAAVGSCPAQNVQGSFTVYRVAVLLYGPPSTNDVKPFY